MLEELGLTDIKVAAVAKGPDRNAGRERIYLKGREPLLLEPRDPVLYCIQTAPRRGPSLRHRRPPCPPQEGDPRFPA